MRRLVLAAAAWWVGRWALREAACLVGTKVLPPGTPPKDSPRQPGLMPGPFDR